jgi:hypothetical protein
MSELQNRIVERLAELNGSPHLDPSYELRERLLKAAIGLFRASGGDMKEVTEIAVKAYDSKPLKVADAVAQMVVATAAVSHASDLDLVQAAYNWINKPSSPLSD